MKKDEYEKVLALEPDFIVTAAFGQMCTNEILEAPKYGCINVHASSLLPETSGRCTNPLCTLWKGRKNRSYNYVYGRKNLDDGDILTQVERGGGN